jgi:hypothetical protein
MATANILPHESPCLTTLDPLAGCINSRLNAPRLACRGQGNLWELAMLCIAFWRGDFIKDVSKTTRFSYADIKRTNNELNGPSREGPERIMKRLTIIMATCGAVSCAQIADSHSAATEALFGQSATLRSVCNSSDIDGFRYFYFREAPVRKAFVAGKVRIVRPGMPDQSVTRAAYTPHNFNVHQDVETLLEPGREWVHLKIDIKPSADGAFQVKWVRADYDLHGEEAAPYQVRRTYGPVGYLTFVRANQCWELSEDRIEAGPLHTND